MLGACKMDHACYCWLGLILFHACFAKEARRERVACAIHFASTQHFSQSYYNSDLDIDWPVSMLTTSMRGWELKLSCRSRGPFVPARAQLENVRNHGRKRKGRILNEMGRRRVTRHLHLYRDRPKSMLQVAWILQVSWGRSGKEEKG